MSERHVRATKKAYADDGITGIKPKTRGRRKGEKRTLIPLTRAGNPNNYRGQNTGTDALQRMHVDANNIRSLILQKYKIDMPLSTLGYYLERWGFSVQRPIKRAYKQDEEQVKNWVESEFPGISERAKAEKAEIFFGDETGLQNTSNYARGYAPIGKTPVVQTESKHIKITCYWWFPIVGNYVLYYTKTT